MKLLKEDQIDLMASDAHDTEYRVVNIREAAELISLEVWTGKSGNQFLPYTKKDNFNIERKEDDRCRN